MRILGVDVSVGDIIFHNHHHYKVLKVERGLDADHINIRVQNVMDDTHHIFSSPHGGWIRIGAREVVILEEGLKRRLDRSEG